MTNFTLNPDDVKRACEVARKAINLELSIRQEYWADAEARSLKGDPHFTPAVVSDFYEDMMDADRAMRIWNEHEILILSPFKGSPCDSVKQS